MKFQNLIIISFQTTVNRHHYVVVLDIQELLVSLFQLGNGSICILI